MSPKTYREISQKGKLTGLKEIERRYSCHESRSSAIFTESEKLMGKTLDQLKFISVQLSEIVLVEAFAHGECIEANDFLGGEGPMGLTSSGDVPTHDWIKEILGERLTAASIEEKIFAKSGLSEYGIKRYEEIDGVYESSQSVKTAVDAMAYQVAKSIGYCLIALRGECEGIVLFGDGVESNILVQRIKERVGRFAHVFEWKDACNGDLILPMGVKQVSEMNRRGNLDE